MFLHDNRCRGTVCSRNTLLDIVHGADSIELIPVVHDYIYDFSKSIRNRYGKEQIIYYTDTKIYRRRINPIKSWYADVLTKFDPVDPDFKFLSTHPTLLLKNRIVDQIIFP